MVATLKSISSSGNAGKYFYFKEKDFESVSHFHDSQGAKDLEVQSLNRKTLENLLDGKLKEGLQLGRITKAGIKHHPGQELILSSPKSVSIMGLVAKDERVLLAHERAVGRTLDYIEKHMIYTRVQERGNLRLEKTDNAVFARFTHLTSRALKVAKSEEEKVADPQLHTHCLIINATKCKDGEFRSIVFDDLYDNKMFIGQIYRLELARNLKEIGYDVNLIWDKRGRFTFEIAGVPEEDIKNFSKRRIGILEEAEKQGVEGAESLAYIAKITRADKEHHTLENLKAAWKGSVTSLAGLVSLKETAIDKTKAHVSLSLKEENTDKILNYGISHLSEREAVFRLQSLHSKMVTKSGISLSLDEIEASTEKALIDGKLLKSHNKNDNTLTTLASMKAEKNVIKLMQDLKNTNTPVISKTYLEQVLEDFGKLSQGQRDAVHLILTTKDRVIGVQGVAGSGKTTLLKIVKKLAEESDFKLIGVAPTRSSAITLEKSTEIESRTLSSFLAKYDGVISGRGMVAGLDKMRKGFKNKIVILDEASLSSTMQVRALLTLSKKLEIMVVMLGDVNQLGAIDSGKPFYYLQDQGMNTAIIGSIQRQKNAKLLKSVYLAEEAVDSDRKEAANLIYKSLKTLGKENIINVSAGVEAKGAPLISNKVLSLAIYNKWKSLKAEGKNPLVIVPSNALRHEINQRLRAHHIDVSEKEILHQILVSKDLTKAEKGDAKNYREGDVLLFSQNNKILSINKGDYFTVQKVDLEANILEILCENDNYNLKYDISKSYKARLSVFEKEEITLAKGDKIRWTKNSNLESFVVNGNSAVIKSIDEKNIVLDTGENNIESLKLNHPDLQHIDYDYSSTIHGAQGREADTVIGVLQGREGQLNLTTQRAFYVTLSRARENAILIVDNYKALIKKLANFTGAKTSSIEHQLKDSLAEDFKDIREIDLKTSKRLVYLDKAPNCELQNKDETESKRRNFSTSHSFESFLKDKSEIKRLAIKLFGNINSKISKGDSLRFGAKGSISVNLSTGQWYDFSLADGGSLYSLAKDMRISTPSKVVTAASKVMPLQKKPKSQNISSVVQSSVPIKTIVEGKDNNLAVKYLKEHRNIDVENLLLSEDLRFLKKAWSSEDSRYHPGIVAIARSSKGEATALQTTYLDPITAGKNQDLAIQKRSQGILTGSFVEISQNKEADTIFIAEGLETALSILSVQPDSRVLCSLGISNIQNISLESDLKLADKTIIICADNDKNEASRLVIDKAANILSNKGFKSVSVIRPELYGQDFNDVLKEIGKEGVIAYITPLLEPHPCYKTQFLNLENKIYYYKQKLADKSKTSLQSLYRSPERAKESLNNLLKSNGLKAALKNIQENPEILGDLKGYTLLHFKTRARTKALSAFNEALKDFKEISLNTKLKMLHEHKYLATKAHFIERYLSEVISFATTHRDKDGQLKSFSAAELKKSIEGKVIKALSATDKKCDFHSVTQVTEKIVDQVIQYRSCNFKEPSMQDKKVFFLHARYELEREPQLKGLLMQQTKSQAFGKNALNQKLEHLIRIDLRKASRLAINKDKIYYAPPSSEEVIKAFNNGEKKMQNLTKEFIQRDMDPIKAHFMATEIVKHEERYEVNMPLKQQSYLKAIGDYVSKSYLNLLRSGFSKDEALCTYLEGTKLMQNYDKSSDYLNVKESQLRHIQQESKNWAQQNQSQALKLQEAHRQSNVIQIEKHKSLEIEL